MLTLIFHFPVIVQHYFDNISPLLLDQFVPLFGDYRSYGEFAPNQGEKDQNFVVTTFYSESEKLLILKLENIYSTIKQGLYNIYQFKEFLK